MIQLTEGEYRTLVTDAVRYRTVRRGIWRIVDSRGEVLTDKALDAAVDRVIGEQEPEVPRGRVVVKSTIRP